MEFLDEYLKSYYANVFPSNLFYKWLGNGDTNVFYKREFSFTLKNGVYVRYLSFEDDKELTEQLKKLNPQKIDIGAVYNISPKQKKGAFSDALLPEWKEIVLDIDINDYDDVRFCCTGANVCKKCWTLMSVGMKLIDRILREDFGFEHILWVFSGRRGVHCWIADKKARNAKKMFREGIANYINMHKKGILKIKKQPIFRCGYHIKIDYALPIARSYFEKYVFEDQAFLSHQKGIDYILSMLPEELMEGRDLLRKKWIEDYQGDEDPIALTSKRWAVICQYLERENHGETVKRMILQILYPRIDVPVTIGLNHLLKAPFCVHPSTGKICVPIDFDNLDEFDPNTAVTVEEVLREFNSVSSVLDTKLGTSIRIFEEFVKNLENDL